MNMRNYSIGTRIGAGCSLLVAVVAVIAGLGWMGVSSIQSDLRTLYADYTVSAFDLSRVRADLGRYRSSMLLAVGAPNKNEFESIRARLGPIRDSVKKSLDAYASMVLRVSRSGRSETEDLKKFQAAIEDWFKTSLGIIASLEDAFAMADPDMQIRMKELAQTVARTEGATKSERAFSQYDELMKTVEAVAKDVHENGQSSAKSAKWVLAVGLTVALILAGLITFLIKQSVVKPLQMVNAALDDIADGEGDLTKRLTVDGRNEVGRLCETFNRFVGKLHVSISRVAATTASLAAAAEELSVNTTQLSKGGQEQAQQATQAAAAVEEMSATVTEMAKNAQGVASTAQDANRAAGQGNDVVANSVTGMTRLAETVRTSAERIQSLGHRSEQIGEIVKVIEDIADQTNLLALNAAIEAARAGEQGRGFAVVADEVRKLAERTTKATKEIADTIRTIQSDTGGAVASMETGTREAQEGMAMANKAGERLGEIVGAVQTVTGMIQQIAAAIEEQSTATDQIAGNIESVAAVSKRNEGGLAQVTQATGELARLAGDLQSVVGGFKLKG